MSNSIDTSFLNKYTNNDYNSLFSSLPKKEESSVGGLAGLASEFSSIKSGSYGKLLNAYYKKMNGSDSATEAIQKEDANRKLVGGNAATLKSAAQKLSKLDFADEKSKDSNLAAVKDFISAYNSVIDTADDTNSKGILRNAVWMTNIAKKSAGLLNEVGITVGKDNKLSLDEAKWTDANSSAKTSLFTGRQGFAEKMVYKAGQMTNFSAGKASYTASAYKSNGEYNKVSAQSIYEELF